MPASAKLQVQGGRHRASLTHYARKPSPSGWSVGQLSELKEVHHCFRGDLAETAAAMGREPADCDIALWHLLGKTPTQALQSLEAAAKTRPPRRTRLEQLKSDLARVEQRAKDWGFCLNFPTTSAEDKAGLARMLKGLSLRRKALKALIDTESRAQLQVAA